MTTLPQAEIANQFVGSHHGEPELTRRDIWLLECHSLWVETAQDASGRAFGLPHYPDWIKSRLFWRIRSGKPPLKYAPPTCYSCPWYELIDMPDIAHSVRDPIKRFDFFGNGELVCSVAQCRYEIVYWPSSEPTKDNPAILKFGNYRFRSWNGLVEWTGKNGSSFLPGAFIQFAGAEVTPICYQSGS